MLAGFGLASFHRCQVALAVGRPFLALLSKRESFFLHAAVAREAVCTAEVNRSGFNPGMANCFLTGVKPTPGFVPGGHSYVPGRTGAGVDGCTMRANFPIC